ncbi:DUF4908 domain-containing protein [Phenylobacterium sp.]|uniref:DUF4908 domain-containing protein n=1 Tax=Phenylobacterium sp. TaxID=1871053 RepID=UPI0035679389
MPLHVMTGEPLASSRTGSAAVSAAILCIALGIAHPAAAGPVESLRQGLFGSRPSDGRQFAAPPVARYVSEDGDVFTLDKTQPKPLLKFENSFEVWALQPQAAPRGDTIYKNDLGEPVLRATRLGGVTIFTDQRPGGSAAALAGVGTPLRLAIMGPQALLERLAQASARASRAARRLIPFEAEATPTSSALIADSAMVTSEAVVRMTKRTDSRRLLDRILKVRLVEGRKSAAQIYEGVLQVTVAPPQGVAGRPSSDLIVQVCETIH